MPEILWKSYIDFENDQNEHQNVRKLYERLMQKTRHVRVWISYAMFESSIDDAHRARDIFEKADKYFKTESRTDDTIESRVALLEAWEQFESQWGSPEQIQKIQKKQPRRVKRKRPILTDNGHQAGWQEYYDYIFPDSKNTQNSNFKLLERAKQWKKTQQLKQLKIQKQQQNEQQNEQQNNDQMNVDP